MTTPTPDPALTDHAARLLLGTDHTPATALAAASGTTPATSTLTAALRDGWTAAQDGERS